MDIYSTVTNRITQLLEQGTVPWVQDSSGHWRGSCRRNCSVIGTFSWLEEYLSYNRNVYDISCIASHPDPQ